MAVRGLLYGEEVVPVGRLVVRPRYHAVQQVAFALRHTAEHAVDHRHSLSAGDAGVGVECAVRIARNPAERRRSLDLVFRPVTGNVGEAAVVLDRFGVEARTDRRKFRTSDRGIGVKAVRTAALTIPSFAIVEIALLCHWPFATSEKTVVGGQISVADVRFEQSEEDCRRFRAADIALRVYLAVRVADDVGEVVVAVELVRHTGSLPACIDSLVAGHLDAADLLSQFLIRIPAGKGITLAGRGLVERHLCAGRIALILVSCAAVRLIVQRIAGRMMGGGTVSGVSKGYRCGVII